MLSKKQNESLQMIDQLKEMIGQDEAKIKQSEKNIDAIKLQGDFPHSGLDLCQARFMDLPATCRREGTDASSAEDARRTNPSQGGVAGEKQPIFHFCSVIHFFCAALHHERRK